MARGKRKKTTHEWFFSELDFDNINDAQEARHDYAHLDFHTRLIKIPATKGSRQYWELWLKHGPRLTHPRCCVEKKHWRVDASKEKSTFIPPEHALRFRKKWLKIA